MRGRRFGEPWAWRRRAIRAAGREQVAQLCGDAAFTCGVLRELKQCERATRAVMSFFNEMSGRSTRNVGAIASYFNKIVTNRSIAPARGRRRKFLAKLAGTPLEVCAQGGGISGVEAVKGLIGRA